MQIPRILVAAPASGSGKTAVSCALMQAFQERGLCVRACKCGPDYIDPMFHQTVLGVDSRNLDLFFCSRDGLRNELLLHGEGADLLVTEGVMGYYDGRAMDTDAGSSYDVATALDMPVILVINCRGAALSLAAQVLGMIGFRPDSNIRGILLNRVSGMLYPRLKTMLVQELKKEGFDLPVLGYIPEDDAFCIESRHLGLVTPWELEGLEARIGRGARILSETVDLDAILSIARSAPELTGREKTGGSGISAGRAWNDSPGGGGGPVRIGIARDEAFCFYYKANLELLEKAGCRLIPFSPLHDRELPKGLCGLLFGGGYPELHAPELSGNRQLREEIRRQVLERGMPCIAECGGFMYLQEEIADREGKRYPAVGAVPGAACPAGKLKRFGYVNISVAKKSNKYLKKEETIKGHEFHYWDSTDCGDDCRAQKPDGKRSWNCIHARGNLFAGYPHLYLPSLPEFARRFADTCREWKAGRGNGGRMYERGI